MITKDKNLNLLVSKFVFSYYVYSNQSNYVCCGYSALYGHRDWLIKYIVFCITQPGNLSG